MKRFLEIIVSIVLHPIALLLMLINLIRRDDLTDGRKLLWGFIGLLWGIGPIVYILVGDGLLW
jgi:hypothetical protein